MAKTMALVAFVVIMSIPTVALVSLMVIMSIATMALVSFMVVIMAIASMALVSFMVVVMSIPTMAFVSLVLIMSITKAFINTINTVKEVVTCEVFEEAVRMANNTYEEKKSGKPHFYDALSPFHNVTVCFGKMAVNIYFQGVTFVTVP